MVKVCLLAAVILAASCHRDSTSAQVPPPPLQPQQAPPRHDDQLARGEYLADIAGCTTCHGRTLAGGDELQLGNGTARMPNITPDRETGVGTWSDAQIIAAIRQGVRPDGAHLAPLMPYPYYNRMTDADASAIVAFVRAQRPIRNEVARGDHLPMKPIEMTAPRGNVDRVEDLHAHGEYIASLMHCGACHTPTQGPHANQTFAGGMAFGSVIAANITPDRDTGIGTWSDQDIVRAVREMKDAAGQSLRPPMASYRVGWSHLSDADARALVFFVRSVPPVHHDVANENPSSVSQQP